MLLMYDRGFLYEMRAYLIYVKVGELWFLFIETAGKDINDSVACHECKLSQKASNVKDMKIKSTCRWWTGEEILLLSC